MQQIEKKTTLHPEKENSRLAYEIISFCLQLGVKEYCVCPGGRNTSFIECLNTSDKNIRSFFFYEERSAAFFALGRGKLTGCPIAVITTSGTAVGELLPAAMEAYYSGIPVIFITADRPRRFRGSGAPQTAEQQNIFGVYAPYFLDLEFPDVCRLPNWDRKSSIHLNACMEESYKYCFEEFPELPEPNEILSTKSSEAEYDYTDFYTFMNSCKHPIVIVSTLEEKTRSSVMEFLSDLKIPFYCEAISGIRESAKSLCESFCLTSCDKFHTSIDGIIRIGGVPTLRLWRDLETKNIPVLSLSPLPFSGLSGQTIESIDLQKYLSDCPVNTLKIKTDFSSFMQSDREYAKKISDLIAEELNAEQSMVRKISEIIPGNSHVFLGNSLSIRHWDMYATYKEKNIKIFGSRGLNGIDGQISTFLGVCDPKASNWALIGDLTALYDLAGPWIIHQMENININIIVMNNGGGKIFSGLFSNPQIQNKHNFSFEHFAGLWKLDYVKIEGDFDGFPEYSRPRLIECVPDDDASYRFKEKLKKL